MSKKYPERRLPRKVSTPPSGYYYVGRPRGMDTTPPGWLCWDLTLEQEQQWDALFLSNTGWTTCPDFVFAAPKEDA